MSLRAPWLVRALWASDEALDLVDDHGHADHGKSLTTVVIVWVLVLMTVGRTPAIGIVIVLLAASFGARIFIAFLHSRVVTSAEALTGIESFGGSTRAHDDGEPFDYAAARAAAQKVSDAGPG